MTRKQRVFRSLLCSCFFAGGALADQQLLKNGSMESGGGPNSIDPQVPASWTENGTNIERSSQYNLAPANGAYSLKAFGDSASTTANTTQEILSISAGQSVLASVNLFTAGNDKLGGSGQAGLVLEFLGTFGNVLGTQTIYVLDASSPADTWIPASLGPFVAPANTAKCRITCRLQWSLGNVSGACWWDGASLTVNGGPNRVVNGDFETAGNSPGQSSVGIDDWAGFNDQEKSGLQSLDGDFSLQLGTRVSYSGLYQTNTERPLTGGDQVLLLARAYVPSTDQPNAAWRAGIKLEFQANGQAPPPEEVLGFTQASAQDTWVPVTLTTTVPPLATIARLVCIWVADGSSTGEAHFDTVFAERSSSPGVNQLQNAGFEAGFGGPNGIDNWTEFFGGGSQCQLSCFGIPARDGDCTARATGPAVAGIYQEIPCVAGETLTFTGWIRQPSSNPLTGAGTKAGVKIEWVLGSVPGQIDIGAPNTSSNTIGPGCALNSWIPLYIDFTMPPGTNASGRFVCIIEKGTSTSGHVYLDNCEMLVLNAFNGADADGDGDEDMHDYAVLQRTFNGSGNAHNWPGTVFDFDGDGDNDINDFVTFLSNFNGPQN